jgi:hypothetical protein
MLFVASLFYTASPLSVAGKGLLLFRYVLNWMGNLTRANRRYFSAKLIAGGGVATNDVCAESADL